MVIILVLAENIHSKSVSKTAKRMHFGTLDEKVLNHPYARRIREWFTDEQFSEILAGSFLSLWARLAGTACGLISNLIIARMYGADVLGTVAVLNSFLLLGATFPQLGADTAVLRLIPEHEANFSSRSACRLYRKTLFLVSILGVAGGTLLAFGSDLVAGKIFGKSYLSSYFALAAPFIVFQALTNLNTQAVRGLRLLKTYAFMQVFPQLSALSFLIAAPFAVRSQDIPIYALFVGICFTGLLGLAIVERTFRRRIRPSDHVKTMKLRTLVSISLPMLITSRLNLLVSQTGIIMLGMFRSEEEVGYYVIAVRIATLINFMLVAVNSMAAPKLSELFQRKRLDELRSIAQKSTRLIFWATTPVLISLLIFGRYLIIFLFGSGFMAAYPGLVLLLLGQFMTVVSGTAGIFLNMTGSQGEYRNIVLVAAALQISANLLLIPRYGLVGAGVGAMVTMAFTAIGAVVYIRWRHGWTIGYLPRFLLKRE